MSDRDSFIDEVTEEVRRDRLFGYVRRYGWIAALLVVLIVAAAAWNEWRKAQEAAKAEALGDTIIAALTRDDAEARADAVATINAEDAEPQAVVNMIAAAELAGTGEAEAAADQLAAVAENGEVPEIYRQLAGFKALLISASDMPPEERRAGFEAFAIAGNRLRLLAEEQLALLSVETGETDAALAQLNAIMNDAEASPDLQQRAMQVIVALGGEPEGTDPAQAGN